MARVAEDKVYIVGVGASGRSSLAPEVAELIDRAETLVGGERLLNLFPGGDAERLTLKSDLRVMAQIEARLGGRRVVVLASGDPGFFGIAKGLVARLGKERVEIIPNVSSLQLAFARIKESWDDATFATVHGRPLAAVADLVQGRTKVAILGDSEHSPAAMANVLLAAGIQEYRAYVCENLGLPDERVLELDIAQLAEQTTSGLAILILIRKADEAGEMPGQRNELVWTLGIPDDEFFQRRPRRGLITKLEVRLASLARLRLRKNSVVWDVGAGSGSVAVEAALIAKEGRVFAVERKPDDVALIRQNVAKFGSANVSVVQGEAPEALQMLPDPDAVFIGGSGGQLAAILDVVSARLRVGGHVVVNAATLETVNTAATGLKTRGFTVSTTLMQVSRSVNPAGMTRFEALDPVFIVAGSADFVG